MRVSKISIRETREVGPFQFRRIEVEVSVLKDDDLNDAEEFAVRTVQSLYLRCEEAAPTAIQKTLDLETTSSSPHSTHLADDLAETKRPF